MLPFRGIFSLLIFITIGMLVWGCSSGSSDAPDLYFEKGEYSFTLYDSLGNKVADGVFHIKNWEGDNISGTYDFTKMYVSDFPGLNTMTGNFTGNITDNKKHAVMNTNPKLADSNVFINLTALHYSFSGDWKYATLTGTRGSGGVKAFRLK